jgi:hypothetical protein
MGFLILMPQLCGLKLVQALPFADRRKHIANDHVVSLSLLEKLTILGSLGSYGNNFL